jgi:hypothetical protein
MERKIGDRTFNGLWSVTVYMDRRGLFHKGRQEQRIAIGVQPNGLFTIHNQTNCTISEPLPEGVLAQLRAAPG